MELKKYQKAAIDDLRGFLYHLGERRSLARAFSDFWNEKKGGLDELMPPYRDVISGVPKVCFKIPTGGGKTFVACAAIKPVFDNIPPTLTKAVVWLVPSDSILEQTKRNLKDGSHPYRQKINVDFNNCVEVYEKSELLNGQNFTPTTVREQLSIFVLSYDSFRSGNKEGRKAYQQNGQLAQFVGSMPDGAYLEGTDETALIQVIRSLNPVVIIDESHHATSELSNEMLENFNPSFILELTATPKSSSNVISYVCANALKAENMIKLPVIVYNKRTKEEVIAQAIDTRDKLEALAKSEKRYIRPIVLFQAEPKGKENASTFEMLKKKLIALDIPEDQIAIQTSNVKELKNVDLLSESCPIRYIITVNALKEGWDCPFAYILATIANRTSNVDVEQILGRILRLPYSERKESDLLNSSYVYTSSGAFQETLKKVVAGLQNAGFSDKDYRVPPPRSLADDIIEEPQQTDMRLDSEIDFNIDDVLTIRARITDADADIHDHSDLDRAMRQVKEYNDNNVVDDTNVPGVPPEVRDQMKTSSISKEFADEVKTLRLPQFILRTDDLTIFGEKAKPLEREDLYAGFSLAKKDAEIDFSNIGKEMKRIDTDGESTLKVLPLSQAEQDFLKTLPIERRVHHCKEMIVRILNNDDGIDHAGLSKYVGSIVDEMSAEQTEDLQINPRLYSEKIKRKIKTLRTAHAKERFEFYLETGKITCEPCYEFKQQITLARYTTMYPKSLYDAEESMNSVEEKIVEKLANDVPNIKWWHRNISKQDFMISGYVNAYPDIIAMTQKGNILMIEPKGHHLDGEDSRNKVEIGRKWQEKAGSRYRYYMVFLDKDIGVDGAYKLDDFLKIVREL